MKSTYLLFLFLGIFTTSLLAQGAEKAQPTSAAPASKSIILSVEKEALARSATDQLVAKYGLNADQAKQMYTIQVRKQRNLIQLETIRTTKPDTWRAKMKSLQDGTVASIRRVLRTKAQVDLYQKTQQDLRLQRAEKRKEMMVKKASKEEIELALLDVYAE